MHLRQLNFAILTFLPSRVAVSNYSNLNLNSDGEPHGSQVGETEGFNQHIQAF